MLETLTNCAMTWNFPKSSKYYKALWPKIEKGRVVLVKLKTQHLCTGAESYLCNRVLGEEEKNYFANKDPNSQSYGFSRSHVWMWELDHKEGWVPKDWCFWTVVLEEALESPLDSNEIQLVHPKGDQSWVFIGRTDAEAVAPVLWPPDAKR